MFGLTFEKLVLVLIIAAFFIGPSRLPIAAAALGRVVRSAREMIQAGKSRVESDVGAELGEIDWKTLDPRQYDPRRIIREALLDDNSPPKPPSRQDRERNSAPPSSNVIEEDPTPADGSGTPT